MRKLFFLLMISLLLFRKTTGQIDINANVNFYSHIDTLKRNLEEVKEDSDKAGVQILLGSSYQYVNPDSAIYFLNKAFQLSKQINWENGQVWALGFLSSVFGISGDFVSALESGMKGLSIAQNLNDSGLMNFSFTMMAGVYYEQEDYKEALKYMHEAVNSSKSLDSSARGAEIGMLGSTYEKIGLPDSALYYCFKSFEFLTNWSGNYLHIGEAYAKKGFSDSALYYYRKAIPLAEQTLILIDIVDGYYDMSKVFESTGKLDSAIFYAHSAIAQKMVGKYPQGELKIYKQLAHLYELKGNRDSTLKYLKLSVGLNEKLFSTEKTRKIQNLAFTEQLHQQELQQQKEQSEIRYRNQLNIYMLLAGLLILLIVAVGLWRRNIYRKRSFALLQKQKQETDNQKQKVETTLEELKSTQAQLIQSEKMASFGELTAGIAHEIQNPLNFVNNFSEVNKELVEELRGERRKAAGERNTAIEDEILDDIEQNLEKINHHGKRADAIVKGMLQHSKASSGKKEPTDINALCDEYLRLAYHGMRAKDKDFNAEIKTDFDESIENLNIIPQDIGRVLLNLFNNAFYAVNEKKQKLDGAFEPVISVSTKKENENIVIEVADNGNGIPRNIIDKIFQPFFTTKPTGQGTGLGLSLAYDIIKAHGGEIKVATKEGTGSEFIIQLPG